MLIHGRPNIQVDKRFQSLIDSNHQLQVQIECANVGVTAPVKHATAEVLQAIRDYQKAWRTLDWTSVPIQYVPGRLGTQSSTSFKFQVA